MGFSLGGSGYAGEWAAGDGERRRNQERRVVVALSRGVTLWK